MRRAVLTLMACCFSTSTCAAEKMALDFLLGSAEQDVSILNETIVGGETRSNRYNDSARGGSFGLRLGYQPLKYLSVEAAHYQNGEVEYLYSATVSNLVSSRSTHFGCKASRQLAPRLAVNGRLGIAIWDVDITGKDSSNPDTLLRVKWDGKDIYYSAGVEYTLNKHLAAGLEYSVINMNWSGVRTDDYSSHSQYDVNTISVVIGAKF